MGHLWGVYGGIVSYRIAFIFKVLKHIYVLQKYYLLNWNLFVDFKENNILRFNEYNLPYFLSHAWKRFRKNYKTNKRKTILIIIITLVFTSFSHHI